MKNRRTPVKRKSKSTARKVAPLAPLPAEAVRWRCRADLPFETTTEIEPARGVVGQDAAVDALRFGLEHYAAGQNIFVRGLVGTGRMTLIRQLLEQIRPKCKRTFDRCYVHNFDQENRPRLLDLPRGTARKFSRRVDELIAFIKEDLPRAMASDAVKGRKEALENAGKTATKEILEPLERELNAAGLALVPVQTGAVPGAVMVPLVDGRPVPPDEYEKMRVAGKITDEEYQQVIASHQKFGRQLQEVSEKLMERRLSDTESLQDFVRQEARNSLESFLARTRRDFPQSEIGLFLNQLVEDLVENRLLNMAQEQDFLLRYRVNVVLEHGREDDCPIVIENAPNMLNLLGSIDFEVGPMGAARSDHMMIRAGSILRADGGYLVLDARDVLSEPGAWKVLIRTLRNSRLEIVPPELTFMWGHRLIKPEPVDLNVKVVLVGDAQTYYMLDRLDPEFPHLFKVLADFDSTVPRDETGIAHYTSVIAKIVHDESLPGLDREAVCALIEHGARIAARRGKLTARFSRLADIIREAAFLATRDERKVVTADDVRETITRTKRRADLPSRRFRELLADGTIRVQTEGSVIGQVNGLAVLQAGQLSYGFPARITATIGAGSAGVINIEREANLSGAIHTKGFYILSGLLRQLLRTDHPLAFSASIAFEQSYGGIDGDSASGAEICCLLSALTDIPLRQDLAMTGAIDQHGSLLAIGAVNEKIEGFFETCRDVGLTGTQGVIIPKSNAGDLMLRQNVVDACANGQFYVYAADDVCEALELLTGYRSGKRDDTGRYEEGSLLAHAVDRARDYWLKASQPQIANRESIDTAEESGEKPEPKA